MKTKRIIKLLLASIIVVLVTSAATTGLSDDAYTTLTKNLELKAEGRDLLTGNVLPVSEQIPQSKSRDHRCIKISNFTGCL